MDLEVDCEDSGCPVCFEDWTAAGPHRLCCLKCGHLFGKSCIEKWLRSHSRCPQCNFPAKKQDIRILFAKTISCTDNSLKEELQSIIEAERMEKMKFKENESRLLLQQKYILEELEKAKSTIKLLEKQLNYSISDLSTSSSKVWNMLQSKSSPLKNESYRCLAYDEINNCLLSSQEAGEKCGISKFNVFDLSFSEFMLTNNKPIKDLKISPFNNGLVLAASLDSSLKIINLNSNCFVHSFPVNSPVWSCAFDSLNRNIIYCGSSTGSCSVFDIRKASSHLLILQTESKSKMPINSMVFSPQQGLICSNYSGILNAPNLECSFLEEIWSSNSGSIIHLSADFDCKNIFLACRTSSYSLPVKFGTLNDASLYIRKTTSTLVSKTALYRDSSFFLSAYPNDSNTNVRCY